jgi:cytochrome c oxidase subunit 4
MSQHHHSEDSTTHLYEGDQSKLYSGIMNHHYGHDVKGEGSKTQMKRIWRVFWILLAVTIVEVILGMYFSHALPKPLLAFFFLALTLFKAAYIVSIFMHLGDEKKNFMITVLIPLTLFIWFIIAFLADGNFWLFMNETAPVR